MEDKLFSSLSLCRKAGKLRMGMDTVKEEILSGGTRLILLSSDISERSERQIRLACGETGARAVKISYDMLELSRITGKPYAIIAVCDEGFAGMLRKLLPPEEPGEQEETVPIGNEQ